MSPRTWLRRAVRTIRDGRRRTWSRSGHAWIELRPGADHDAAIEALERLDGVQWATFNAHHGRVVVRFGPGRQTRESLVACVQSVEDRLGVGRRPFAAEPPPHPGDMAPIHRLVAETIADLVALLLGAVFRRRAGPMQIDIAAALTALRDIPWLRRELERRLGLEGTDLVLSLLSAASHVLTRSRTGPAVALVLRGLRYREVQAQRHAWHRFASARHLAKDDHPPRIADGQHHPGPLPRGPVEDYSAKAVAAALGAFGIGVAGTGRIESASASIFGGVPKPARLGREAFAAELGKRLAEHGIVVLRPRHLRHLDRIDALVVGAGLLDEGAEGPEPAARALVDAARRAGLRLVAIAEDPARVAWARPARTAPPSAEEAAIRELHKRHLGVMLIARGPDASYCAADLSAGIDVPGEAPPWAATLLARGLVDAALVLEGLRAARRASAQSVAISSIEAATGMILSIQGLQERTTRRIMAVSNAATLVAIVNGVRLARRVRAPAVRERGLVPWHRLPAAEVLSRLASSEHGLTTSEAAMRRRPGPAEERRLARVLRTVGEELASPLVPVLATGTVLSAIMGSLTDAALVGGVVGINAVVGAVERGRSERALRSLNGVTPHRVSVCRDTVWRTVDPGDLVPGDVVRLEAGDLVPADARVLKGSALEVDESALTGESLPVRKSAAPSRARDVAERTSMLWAGTTVAAGSALAVVVAVGENTEMAGAAELAGASAPGGVEARLAALTEKTVPVAAASGVAVMLAGLSRGRAPRDVVGAAVSLMVAAVPEGLPILATLAQHAAARRLSDHGTLVRNPRAIEALGRIDVLCADKTGTLTEGRVRLRGVSLGDGLSETLGAAERDVLAIAARASPRQTPGRAIPHLTDRAIIDAAVGAGIALEDGFERVEELPFESERGYHAVLARDGGRHQLCIKGAPEVVLPACRQRVDGGRRVPLAASERRRLEAEGIALARRGLRVLAVAERHVQRRADLGELASGGLTFRGFVALSDLVRPTSRAAIEDLQKAGVEVKMITGDHPSTALTIAAELGLGDGDTVLTGADLDALDDAALEEIASDVTVFARVTPRHKVRIVRALRKRGRAVGMTGDGANDAAAMRLADVGIALGRVAAAREAADIVVADERIETIVHAVLEGRALWSSVRDAVALLVGGNIGEIGFTLAGGLALGRTPLGARQLLLVNILTDTFPALAVALAPPALRSPAELLGEGPDVSLGRTLDRQIAWRAAVTGLSTAAGWTLARLTGSQRRADTVGLLTLVGAQLGQTLAVGHRDRTVFWTSLGSLAALLAIVETPGLSGFFGCRPLGPVGLAQAAAAAVSGTAAAVLGPRIARRLRPRLEASKTLKRLRDADVVRILTESRWLDRLRRAGEPTYA